MPLAEFLLVGSENERHVRKFWRRSAQCLEQQNVLRRVRDVIVAANNVSDPHVDVIGDNRQVVNRQPVRSQDHEIFDLLVIDFDVAAHVIGICGLAFGHFEPDRRLRTGGFTLLLLLD